MTRWVYLSIVLTLATLGGSLTLFLVPALHDLLPEKIPTHWGITGQPDAWMSTIDPWAFLLFPLIMVAMLALIFVLPWLSPRKFDLDRFRGTFHYIMFLLIALMAYLHFAALLGGLQKWVNPNSLVFAGLFLLFALLGNVLGKVQRNFYVGVRTPWTLASEAVWVRTHRLAAWLFTAAGVVGFVLLVAGVPFYFSLAGVLVAALVPVIYSLLLYKYLERQGRLEPPPEANPEIHAQ
jgi:uncharacterized membrane protein